MTAKVRPSGAGQIELIQMEKYKIIVLATWHQTTQHDTMNFVDISNFWLNICSLMSISLSIRVSLRPAAQL